jgi:hypothetical protein
MEAARASSEARIVLGHVHQLGSSTTLLYTLDMKTRMLE